MGFRSTIAAVVLTFAVVLSDAVADDSATIYHAEAGHLWNRLFNKLYTRPVSGIEKTAQHLDGGLAGGDFIDFLAWGKTDRWDRPEVGEQIAVLLDRFPGDESTELMADPLKRAIMLRDLWAAHDFLIGQNIRRKGSRETRWRRSAFCKKLAQTISTLALTPRQIAELPDTYAAAIKSGKFVNQPILDESAEYLPHGLLTRPDEWVEIDFFQPNLHEDLSDRFVTLHTREFQGRSYFRIFYRYPAGRAQLVDHFQRLEETGIDWKQAAQNGFILLKKDAPQIPIGTEVALVQFMMTLDDQLRPTPTKIVESVRHRRFLSVDGSEPGDLKSNTGLGMHVQEYTLKRRLLFDDLKHGGLHAEPMGEPQLRIIFNPKDAPDWGTKHSRQVLFQQCADCHTTPKGTRTGVHSLPSIVHMGGFGAGAMMSIARPMPADGKDVRGLRAAKWKSRQETYRRMLDQLGL